MQGRPERLHSIDWVRGIVMILMALDHTRDYYGALLNPQDVTSASPALFFTRWITHFCAPTFVFLAGTSAWLYGSRGRSKAEISRFLLTRGLWLIVLEVTVVNFAWLNLFSFALVFWQVIAAIGIAMIALAVLIHLPRPALLLVAVALVAGHNVFDGWEPEPGRSADLWRFLETGAMQRFALVGVGDTQVLVVYPVLAWIGVMVLGYCLGPVTSLPRPARRRVLIGLGLALTLAFVVLRALNGYGDPTPWTQQATPLRTFLSFLNVQKYPPSLAFALMTLGPAILALGLLDREPGAVGRVCVVYGRVPLFYYVAHMLLIHESSRVVHWLRVGEPVSQLQAQFAFLGEPFTPFPDGFHGLSLFWVHVAWVSVVAALYPVCRWYAGVKARSDSVLLSYL